MNSAIIHVLSQLRESYQSLFSCAQGEVNNSSVPGRSACQASPFGSAQITRVPFRIGPVAGLVAVPGLL